MYISFIAAVEMAPCCYDALSIEKYQWKGISFVSKADGAGETEIVTVVYKITCQLDFVDYHRGSVGRVLHAIFDDLDISKFT